MSRLRYLVLHDPANRLLSRPEFAQAQRAAASLDVTTLIARDDIAIFIRRSRHAIFHAQDVVIIGQIYRRSGFVAMAPEKDSVMLAARMRVSEESFLHDHWGAYLALRFTPDGVVAVRDPSGELASYHSRQGDLFLIASDLDSLRWAGADFREFDLPSLMKHMLAPDLRRSATAIAGVSELPRGHRLTVEGGTSSTDSVWSPWDYAQRSAQLTDYGDAVASVREAVLNSVGARARRFDHCLVELSGGLDSSIVAAALAQSGAQFSAVTYATVEKTGDELNYARAVTDMLAVPLHEFLFDARNVDVRRSEAGHLPRPVARSFSQEVGRISMAALAASSADCLMNGGGGDNVFCYLPSNSPILDRLSVEGPGWGAWSTLIDICELTGCSITTAARHLIRARAQKRYNWRGDADFLAADVCRNAMPLAHPWLETGQSTLAGKRAHIAALVRIENYLEGFDKETQVPSLAPLMSQPIMEACLQVPSWFWCKDGLNRAVARDAFRDLLPAQVINRRSKGTPDSGVVRLFEHNRGTLKEMLCDGLLAHLGLLDLAAIINEFTKAGPVRGRHFARLLEIADIEAWAQHVTQVQNRPH